MRTYVEMRSAEWKKGLQGSRKHPAALEACVLEVPNEKRGEAIKAFVAPAILSGQQSWFYREQRESAKGKGKIELPLDSEMNLMVILAQGERRIF